MTTNRPNVTLADVMLRRLKLKPLLVFERVLQSSSIARAARELNLTQPAVTKAVQELEDQLDVKLFERTNRGVVPTHYGALLGLRVKAVIAELRHLTDELNRFRGAETGHVVVGTLISASARLLPLAITEMKKRAPGVLITVHEGLTGTLFPALATGEVDIVVGRLPERELSVARSFSLTQEVLFTDELCVVSGRQHSLADRPQIDLRDLVDAAWIMPVPESPMRGVAERLFADAGLPVPRNIVESLSMLTNINLMLDADVIGLMPRTAAQRFVDAGLLAVLALGNIGRFGDIGYTVRAEKPLTPAGDLFVLCLKHAAAGLQSRSQGSESSPRLYNFGESQPLNNSFSRIAAQS